MGCLVIIVMYMLAVIGGAVLRSFGIVGLLVMLGILIAAGWLWLNWYFSEAG